MEFDHCLGRHYWDRQAGAMDVGVIGFEFVSGCNVEKRLPN
jgi:hypothetical protein